MKGALGIAIVELLRWIREDLDVKRIRVLESDASVTTYDKNGALN